MGPHVKRPISSVCARASGNFKSRTELFLMAPRVYVYVCVFFEVFHAGLYDAVVAEVSPGGVHIVRAEGVGN